MANSQVEEIKSKIDIVSVIGEHVQLTKSGSNFRGLCPFHNEKSPSFMVSEELQIYKCFGCGEGGDVFTFLEKYEGMEFPEALKYLADKTGVKLISQGRDNSSEKENLYEINTLAGKFYNFLLTTHPVGKVALNYLKEERGITEESIKIFNIGFAPANQNVLSDFLTKKKNFKLKDIETAGLISLAHGNVYDRFNGRITFPISDNRGNVIAMAGRLLPPGKPNVGKYINSPETPIYHKSSSLFGLNITKDFIKKEAFAVVVEGEVDLISSYQVGVKNIVAIKGSAFTVDQARLLSRYTKEVVLALDSDFAGVAASIRGIQILDDLEFEVRVVQLGKFKDPDEAARADANFYKDKISKSIGIWDFIIDSIVDKYDKNTASGKAKISHELTPVLASIKNKIIQDHYIKHLATLLEVNTSSVSEEVEKSTPKVEKEKVNYTTAENKTERRPVNELREEKFFGLILKQKPELLKNENVRNLIREDFVKRIIEEYDKFTLKNKDFDLKLFTNFIPKELLDRFSQIMLTIEESTEIELINEINEVYRQLSIPLLKQKLIKTKDSVLYQNLQKQIKDFESNEFERIIEESLHA